MTVAQLVHSTYGRAPLLRHAPFHALTRAISGRQSRNAALWRAIATGLGLALIGLAMMVVAISAAGIAVPDQQPDDGALTLAQPAPAQHPEIYHGPGSALASMMPVP